MNKNAEFDIIVYGASGFTGRLVAQYLFKTYGAGGPVRWAMAGRNADKLAAVRSEIGVSEDIPLVVADAADPPTLDAMAKAAKCVISTVGPYTLYGMPLVEACVKAGTDYVDLCGEPLWMRETIAKHSAAAKASGARIVHSCGFDSIPSDLGVLLLQDEAKKRFGKPATEIRARVRSMKGSFSGGTAASLKATIAEIMKDASLKAVMFNPFALCEGHDGPQQPADHEPKEDDLLNVWVAPFIMASINAKNVHRTNFLLGHPYGNDFLYNEMIVTGKGDQGKAAAEFVAKAGMGKDADLQPGEGPSKEEREAGSYDFLMMALGPDGQTVNLGVTGDCDPGYCSTSKMLSESALCLIDQGPDLEGGIYTPGAAMGRELADKLIQNAGMTFALEN